MKKTILLAGLVMLVAAGCNKASAPTVSTMAPTPTPMSVPSGMAMPTATVTGMPGTTPSATASPTATPAPGTYTMAQVAAANGASKCWTVINGNVYDVTSWINQHPGGPEHILSICGTDGTSAFEAQHSGQSQPAAELATFKIGTLVK